MLTVRSPMLCAAAAALFAMVPASISCAQQSEEITVDARASTTPLPSFYDFALLHQLGARIANTSHNALVTRLPDGSLAIALWNLASVDEPAQSISTHHVALRIEGAAPNAAVSMQKVDEDHGNVMKAYTAMGSPRYPTRAQVRQMNAASALGATEHLRLRQGSLELDLEPNELMLLHVDTTSPTHSGPSSAHP